MPPKGKSKALANKHGYLGKFTQIARNKDQMQVKINEQQQEIQKLEKIITENEKRNQK